MEEKDFIYVYLYTYHFEFKKTKMCKNRIEYIKNDKFGDNYNNEKYFGWKLLETLFNEKLSIDINNLNPRRLETGKWVVDDYYISISNSGKYLMVGVSNEPIGVDVQRVSESGSYCVYNNEMCSEEKEAFKDSKPWKYLLIHAEKEAIYKAFFGDKDYAWDEIKNRINVLEYKNKLTSYEYGEYYCSVCSDLIEKGVQINIAINRTDEQLIHLT
ncbi:MAG: hypothetical protein J6Y28_00075 [Acholeplasmatales bacterium]|nr:hypothetical protein [Acholeplasmatales bacterium]